jgi:predicted XRE-type DNA-binding protein
MKTLPTYVLKNKARTVEVVCRSVFGQLGLTRKETLEMLAQAVDEVLLRRNEIKNELVGILEAELVTQGLTITRMANIASVSHPRMSTMLNRDCERFSIDAVVDVMHKFGKLVRIQVVDTQTRITPTSQRGRQWPSLQVR